MRSKAVKAGMGYTIGNFMVKGIQFLAMPLFGRLMTTEEFGVYNVFASYDAILFVFLGLCVHASLRSANQEYDGKLDAYASSISLIYVVNLALFALLLALFGRPLSGLLGFDRLALWLLLLHSFGSSLLSLYNDRLSIAYNYKEYIGLSLCNAVANVLISLALMLTVYSGARDTGRMLGASCAMFAVGVYILIRLWQRARPRYDREYWKFGITYSLPIIPHGISNVLLAQFDRIMIRSMVGDHEAGLYSMAANVKLILLVIMESVANAWSTWFFDRSRVAKENAASVQTDAGTVNRSASNRGNPDEGEIEHPTADAEPGEGLSHGGVLTNRVPAGISIPDAAVLLAAGFAFLTIGLCSVGPEVILLVGGMKYYESRFVLVPMLLEVFALFLYNLVVQSEYVAKRTGYVMAGTVGAAGLNVVLNTIFIMRYGYVAAAWTTLFCYVLYLIFHLIVSRRLQGYAILPAKGLLPFALAVIAVAACDCLLQKQWILRWVLCAVADIPIGLWLLKRMKTR